MLPTQPQAPSKAAPELRPLSLVVFSGPMAIPGSDTMVTTLDALSTNRIVNGKQWVCPPMYYEPKFRRVVISGRCYPIENIRYYEECATPPKALDVEDYNYTIVAKPKDDPKIRK